MLGFGIGRCAGIALRRKFSAREFWDDVRKFNASSIGYVGELCRYLAEVPAKPEDRAHRVTKMVGNGMRPNIWGSFKQRFGIDEVYELYASSEGNIGFSNIFNFDNTVGFSPLPYAIVKYDKENETPVRNKDGFLMKAARGEAGLLMAKSLTVRRLMVTPTLPKMNPALCRMSLKLVIVTSTQVIWCVTLVSVMRNLLTV